MLYLSIHDEDIIGSEFIGHCALPLNCVRQGYRSCRLFDDRGRSGWGLEKSYIFLQIIIE